MNVKKVFISYSHDTPEHTQLALQLGNTLRDLGVEAELDQYHIRPSLGWPRWCEEQLRPENAAFVLVICTRIYRQRVEGKTAADEGRGVFWEGGILYTYLYNEKGNNRFIPVLLPDATKDDIPVPLRDNTRYCLKTFDLNDSGFQALYRELTDQPAVCKPPLGNAFNERGTLFGCQLAKFYPASFRLTSPASTNTPLSISSAGMKSWPC